MINYFNIYCCAKIILSFLLKKINLRTNFFEISELYCTYTFPNYKWNA